MTRICCKLTLTRKSRFEPCQHGIKRPGQLANLILLPEVEALAEICLADGARLGGDRLDRPHGAVRQPESTCKGNDQGQAYQSGQRDQQSSQLVPRVKGSTQYQIACQPVPGMERHNPKKILHLGSTAF